MLTYEALQTEVDAGNLETLKEMYAKWPFFQSTVELIETVMAKVDVDIVKLYQKELVTPVLSLSLSLSLFLSLYLSLSLSLIVKRYQKKLVTPVHLSNTTQVT